MSPCPSLRALLTSLAIWLGGYGVLHALPAGTYTVKHDLEAELLVDERVSGSMVLHSGRLLRVTGEDETFIFIELSLNIKGRIARSEENKLSSHSGVTTTTRPAGQQAPQGNAARSSSTSPAPSNSSGSTAAATPELTPKPPNALAIKGVYIGMPIQEAVRVLNEYQPSHIRISYAQTQDEKAIYGIKYYGISERSLFIDWRSGGSISANLKTGKVTLFRFSGEVSDILFNTPDLSANAFARKLVDNYPIPELKSVMIEGISLWHYESPHGWSLYLGGDKSIELFKTPARRFD